MLGYFGIVVGIEAAYYTASVPSRDDLTALLAIPAEVALVGLGLVMLWRTRRPDGSMVRRYVRTAAIDAARLLVFVFVLFGRGYAYVGTRVARPRVDDIDVGSATVEDSSCTPATA